MTRFLVDPCVGKASKYIDFVLQPHCSIVVFFTTFLRFKGGSGSKQQLFGNWGAGYYYLKACSKVIQQF
jgi:hypothetical protein